MLKQFWHYLCALFFNKNNENSPTPESIPVDDVKALKDLYALSSESLRQHAIDATRYIRVINSSKTDHKRKLYQGKFNRTKRKFQDEISRLIQLEEIFKTNGIVMEVESVQERIETMLELK